METASAIAYSSSANLGPGYDTLALAHSAYYNRVTVSPTDEVFDDFVRLEVKGLPASPYENTAGLAVTELLKDLGINERFRITIESGIPTGLGLGSSGASAAAAVEAVNVLLGLDLPLNQKVRYAALGEAASSGAPHADNVAASICGGLVIVGSVEPMRVRQIKVSDDFSFLTIVPDIRIASKTKTSRELVPNTVSLSDYVEGIRYSSALLSGLITGNRDLVGEGMNDMVVEIAREPLYPYFPEVKKSMLSHNAVGACLSGAGPSVLAVVDEETDKEKLVSDALRIIGSYGHECSVVESVVAGGVNVSEAPATN